MAAAIWPTAAAVEADDYVLSQDTDVERTAFESGAVRQARRYTSALMARAIRAHLDDDAALAAFRAWARARAHGWFAWPDPHDGVWRRVRVRGGAGAIRYVAHVEGASRRWEAELTLEGFEGDRV